MGEIVQNIVVELRVICETLFLTFLILKMTNVVSWSWLAIFSPILLIGGIALSSVIILVIFSIHEKRRKKKIV